MVTLRRRTARAGDAELGVGLHNPPVTLVRGEGRGQQKKRPMEEQVSSRSWPMEGQEHLRTLPNGKAGAVEESTNGKSVLSEEATSTKAGSVLGVTQAPGRKVSTQSCLRCVGREVEGRGCQVPPPSAGAVSLLPGVRPLARLQHSGQQGRASAQSCAHIRQPAGTLRAQGTAVKRPGPTLVEPGSQAPTWVEPGHHRPIHTPMNLAKGQNQQSPGPVHLGNSRWFPRPATSKNLRRSMYKNIISGDQG